MSKKREKTIVSYLDHGDFYYEVFHCKNRAVARFHENALGLYTTKWWHVQIGEWVLPVPPNREDVAIRALTILSDLDLEDPKNKKLLAGWRKTS